ncbi:hypothetical protein AtubIFM56815_009346 [Aspergillus tubingensis]|uniref:Unnamed protein product n=2 Tax=Aspergillus subgen. Circumdati TaxID=2720871 RepID=A0A100IPC0_ASPNG|nr:endoplasmic Reticulum Oxidoreductin 1 (ERO1) family protein [Aspergillus tubingensis]GAQ44859.1 unnamed protein product [Aspergillus niger]GFN11804.1 endoplasmic Reticulum Oxidoreductin 1 (ERO1) family protein [Aspergillus tubingensis]GLA67050.1 hypothetical protein AtubIFM54640_010024 [Aspergillus tubingensis]GLA85119.1 hypothetical protein AtubIFM56815_009346 [Aspergillus tubingensis]GLA93219.1 hypothetical protein AtubIFM57143_010565 [Aspergillus tubingensis]
MFVQIVAFVTATGPTSEYTPARTTPAEQMALIVHNPPNLPVPGPEPIVSTTTATSDTDVNMGSKGAENGDNAVDTDQLQPVDDVSGFDTLDTAEGDIGVISSHTSNIVKSQ